MKMPIALSEKQSSFNLPIIASVVLHTLIFAFLSYSAWQYSDINSGVIDGQAISAVMVEPSVMTQEYQRQLKEEIDQKQLEKQTQIKIEQQKEEAIAAAKKQAELDAEKARQQAEKMKEQALQEKQQAMAALAAEQAKKDAEQTKQIATAAAEKQALDDAKKAEKESKKAKEQAEQATKEAQKQKRADEKALQDILGGLTSTKPKSQQGLPDNEQAKYMSLVKTAISNRFSNPKLYSGRTCTLKIIIANDGLLLDVVSDSGDPHLCRDAITATRQAVIPKPPKDLYNKVKEMIIDFQPK